MLTSEETQAKLELVQGDINNKDVLDEILAAKPHKAIVSCLPYYENLIVADFAKKNNLYYFDLTEDEEISKKVSELAKGSSQAFVPRCGRAPGLINILASDMLQRIDNPDTVKLRVGALPATSDYPLHYALTWSTDGLINEYINPCKILKDGKLVEVPALSDLESIEIAAVETCMADHLCP